MIFQILKRTLTSPGALIIWLQVIFVMTAGAQPYQLESDSLKRVQPFKVRDVHGNLIGIPGSSTMIVSILPKPPGKKEGMRWLDMNRKWMQMISDRRPDQAIVSLVVPYKTGFLFGGMIKRKLGAEPYPVVIDKAGILVAKFLDHDVSSDPPYLIKLDSNGRVLDFVTGEPSKQLVDVFITKGR